MIIIIISQDKSIISHDKSIISPEDDRCTGMSVYIVIVVIIIIIIILRQHDWGPGSE
jgi:hypothetical protein